MRSTIFTDTFTIPAAPGLTLNGWIIPTNADPITWRFGEPAPRTEVLITGTDLLVPINVQANAPPDMAFVPLEGIACPDGLTVTVVQTADGLPLSGTIFTDQEAS
jgi:hypothetical protein